MKIAFASGKGGTGKTFLTTNMAAVLSENGQQVTVIDCDVEEPNCHIFLKPEITQLQDITVKIPVINNDVCTGCRLCARQCQFNALITVKQKTYVFEDMCHSCGLCSKLSPVGAITEDGFEGLQCRAYRRERGEYVPVGEKQVYHWCITCAQVCPIGDQPKPADQWRAL